MAFCSECGTDIGAAKFCSNCGASNAPKDVENKPSESPKNPPKDKQKEKELAVFTDGFKCDIRLTTERIYAKSVGLEETYALRSVDGIGVYDDLEKFKNDKIDANNKAKQIQVGAYTALIMGGLVALLGLYMATLGEDLLTFALIELAIGSGLIYKGYIDLEKVKKMAAKVQLDSYVKIIISGNNKLYLFNKKSKDAAKVAEFINKVEETLTKYD